MSFNQEFFLWCIVGVFSCILVVFAVFKRNRKIKGTVFVKLKKVTSSKRYHGLCGLDIIEYETTVKVDMNSFNSKLDYLGLINDGWVRADL
jgi:hypothetical protein